MQADQRQVGYVLNLAVGRTAAEQIGDDLDVESHPLRFMKHVPGEFAVLGRGKNDLIDESRARQTRQIVDAPDDAIAQRAVVIEEAADGASGFRMRGSVGGDALPHSTGAHNQHIAQVEAILRRAPLPAQHMAPPNVEGDEVQRADPAKKDVGGPGCSLQPVGENHERGRQQSRLAQDLRLTAVFPDLVEALGIAKQSNQGGVEQRDTEQKSGGSGGVGENVHFREKESERNQQGSDEQPVQSDQGKVGGGL